jgi:pilus assembly protein Flp/PilA
MTQSYRAIAARRNGSLAAEGMSAVRTQVRAARFSATRHEEEAHVPIGPSGPERLAGRRSFAGAIRSGRRSFAVSLGNAGLAVRPSPPHLLEMVMKSLASKVKHFLVSEDGPTAVEYAVMLALIVIVCLAAIQAIGQQANATFTEIGDKMGEGNTDGGAV